jgi:divalent metal cation (Fe/Co/Zn/Cd) transporter
LDIEVNGELSSRQAHEICIRVENSIRSQILNVFDVMIHIEPAGYEHKEEVYGVSPDDLPEQ